MIRRTLLPFSWRMSLASLSLLVLQFVASSAVLHSPVRGENWPQWRGPQNNGLSSEKNLPIKWSKTENVAWRLALPGAAGATPVVWGNQIFLTSVDDQDLLLMCIGTDGKERWREKLGRGNRDARGDEGNSAAPSPTTDGKHVWAMFANGLLGCCTVDGKLVWKFNVEERYGKLRIQFGMTSTPLLHDGRLYLQLIHGDGNAKTREALVVCLDALTGEQIWKQDRDSDAVAENEHSYSSPILYDVAPLKFLITHGADYTVAHDLKDGHEIWRCGGLNPREHPTRDYDRTLRFVASPAAVPGMIVIPTAKRGPVVAVRPDGKGTITDNKKVILWEYATTPDVPSPLILDGLVYLCMADGNLHVLDAATGNMIYRERTHRQRHRASPVAAGGYVYLTARDGKVTVVKAGKKFEIVSQNDIEEMLAASPAISQGTIYLRSYDALWAIRKK